MESLKISEILKATKGKLIQGDKRREIFNINIDTRILNPGDLFIAIKGKMQNGHSFINEALQKGACCIITEDARFEFEQWKTVNIIQVENTTRALGDIAQYYREKFNPTVIAITGSNGKTTTKDMVAHILKSKHHILSAPASFNNDIGVPLTVLQLTKDIEILIVEMEMNELGGIKRLCDIAQPDIGVVTNIGDTHLEFLFTRDNVAQEKSELLEAIADKGTAILNSDDLMVMEMWQNFKFQKTITFGIEKFADVYANKIVNHFELGTEFLVCNKYPCRLALPGLYNIYNALAAISVARSLKIDWEEAISSLKKFNPQTMRMQEIKINDITIYNDAFNANPQSMLEALKTFASFSKPGHKIAILGDMLELGRKSAELHKNLGKNLPQTIDFLITVGEQAKFIAEGAKEIDIKETEIFSCNSPQEAVDKLVDILSNHDKILIKGSRLMKLEQIIDLLRKHYNGKK